MHFVTYSELELIFASYEKLKKHILKNTKHVEPISQSLIYSEIETLYGAGVLYVNNVDKYAKRRTGPAD